MIATKPQIAKVPTTFWVLKINFPSASNIQTNEFKKQGSSVF
jgi:hypothetical protein